MRDECSQRTTNNLLAEPLVGAGYRRVWAGELHHVANAERMMQCDYNHTHLGEALHDFSNLKMNTT